MARRLSAFAIILSLGFLMLGKSATAAIAVVHTNVCNSAAAGVALTFSCTITTPAPGNVLVAHMFCDGGGNIGITGFTTADAVAASGIASGTLVVGASPPTAVGFTSSVASHYIGVVVEESGASTTTPVDKHSVSTSSTATTCAAPAVTPTQTGDGIYMYNGNGTDSATSPATPSSSPTNTFSTIAANNTVKGIAGDGATALSSSTSALTTTWTWSTAQSQLCGVILLNPAAASTQKLRPPWTGAMR